MRLRCILAILAILDHLIVFRVIIPTVLLRMSTQLLETCRGFK